MQVYNNIIYDDDHKCRIDVHYATVVERHAHARPRPRAGSHAQLMHRQAVTS